MSETNEPRIPRLERRESSLPNSNRILNNNFRHFSFLLSPITSSESIIFELFSAPICVKFTAKTLISDEISSPYPASSPAVGVRPRRSRRLLPLAARRNGKIVVHYTVPSRPPTPSTSPSSLRPGTPSGSSASGGARRSPSTAPSGRQDRGDPRKGTQGARVRAAPRELQREQQHSGADSDKSPT